MSQKKVKQMRKQTRKQTRKIVSDFMKAVEELPFKTRFSFAIAIIFKRGNK